MRSLPQRCHYFLLCCLLKQLSTGWFGRLHVEGIGGLWTHPQRTNATDPEDATPDDARAGSSEAQCPTRSYHESSNMPDFGLRLVIDSSELPLLCVDLPRLERMRDLHIISRCIFRPHKSTLQ